MACGKSVRGALAAVLAAAPMAGAGELKEGADHRLRFRSPSGNIQCTLLPAGGFEYLLGDKGPEVACVRFDPDWSVAALNASGPAELRDEEFEWPDGVQILPYGEQVVRAPITCTSEKTGMTCRSAGGHGFSLTRAAAKVW